MADQSNNGSSSANAFILGGLVVVVAIIAWVVFGGGFAADEPDISLEVPGVGTVEGEVEGN